MNIELDKILSKLKRDAASDHIGLWEVVRNVKLEFHPDPETLKRITLDCVDAMLSNGFVAGVSEGRAFKRWPDQRRKEIIERVDREWSAMGHEPNIGDIVWFDLLDPS